MKRIIIVFMSLMFIMCLAGCNTYKNSSIINRIKETTDLNFPSDIEIIFEITDKCFMHGRLAQYYVLKFHTGTEDFLIMNHFNTELSENFREKFDNQIDECYSITREDIKSEYFPDFENDNLYLYLAEKDVYLIYDSDNEYLIVFITAQ